MRRADPGQVRFHDGSQMTYEPPSNTVDPRWSACVEHHPACDCREAEFREELDEYRANDTALREAIKEILRGHPAYGLDDRDETGCMCTGCQITRRIHLGHLVGLENLIQKMKETTP